MNDALVDLVKDPSVREQYAKLPQDYRLMFEWRQKWLFDAHDHQIAPSGDWYSVWLMLAGRGAGATRAS